VTSSPKPGPFESSHLLRYSAAGIGVCSHEEVEVFRRTDGGDPEGGGIREEGPGGLPKARDLNVQPVLNLRISFQKQGPPTWPFIFPIRVSRISRKSPKAF